MRKQLLANTRRDPEISSDLDVPDQLRALYDAKLPAAQRSVVEAGTAGIRRAAQSIIDEELEAAPEPPVNTTGNSRDPNYKARLDAHSAALAERKALRDARVDELMSTDFLRLQALQIHREALAAASAQFDHDRARAEKRQADAEARTCPVCGVVCTDAETGLPIDSRPLTPHTMHFSQAVRHLRSCTFCYDEALAQLREQRALEASLVDFRHPTRRDAVEAALSR